MERFNADLELVPWNVVEIFSDIDDQYYIWHTLFLAIFNEHFPIRCKRIHQSTHPWLDKSILSTMRRRDQVHRKARKFNRPSDWSEYRRLRNLINSSLRKAKETYFAEKLEVSRPNPSEVWKTLKQVLPHKNVNCDIDRLIIDDKEVTGHKDIADAMNLYFTSIASSLSANFNEIESEFAPDEAPLNVEPFKFTIRDVNEVSKPIEDLNRAKATGPDGIPVRALKMEAPNISRSLTHLFNESLSTGKFPSAW